MKIGMRNLKITFQEGDMITMRYSTVPGCDCRVGKKGMIQYENKRASRLHIETLMSRRPLLNHIPVVPY